MGPYRISVFLAVLAVTCAVDFGPILPTPLPQDTQTATNTQKYERTVSTTAKDEKTEVKTTIPILSVSQKDVTTVSSTIESTSKQPRAMNLTLPASLANSIQNSTSSESKKSPKMASDLSDVSMDDDMDLDYLPRSVVDENSTLFGEARVVNRPGIRSNERTLVPLEAPFVASAKDVIDSSCVDSGKIYKMGEKVLRDCDEVCTCERGGKLVCQPRCSGPFFRRGRKVDDPLCSEKFVEEDSCCSILVCSADTKSDGCTYGNTTYAIGESFHQGCERSCECNPGGNVTCKARCPVLEQRDDCVNVADDKDHCCMVQLCDVTTDDDDHVMPANIRDAKHDKTVTNSTNSAEEENFGKDKSKNATIVAPSPKAYNISKNITKESINAVPTIKEVTARQNESTTVQPKAEQCTYNGKFYDAGEEFHVGCQKLCLCLDYGQVMCHTLVCPSDQGLDVIDPFCVSWGPDPPDFKPHYPMCCPPTMRCISNGSCEYKGHMLPNWSNIPEELSGCEQRCYCDTGVVECGPVCPPLPAAPPSNLNCQPPHFPKVMLRKGETCCKEWTCVPSAFPGLGGFPNSIPGGPAQDGVKNGEGALQILVLEASSPTSLRLIFSIPSVMVGLHGRVQLRYTDSNNPDPSSWRLQEFAPPDDLLATSQLEFSLGSLRPDTLYRIQAAVTLRQLQDVPRSFIHSVRTPPLQEETTMPPVIAIEPNLAVGQVLATSAQVTWRPFTQDELLYIDGIQLRYREIDGKVFSGTPLIHRAVTSFQLEGLKPNTSYEVGIYFIPFLGQHTELQSANMVRLNTPLLTDMYDWNVVLEVDDITAWSLSLHWTGVPRPAERYVHIYRAVWRAEAARADKSNFSLPARDALPWVNVTGLTPGTRYKIWLELYLTNGKIKTSNVKDVMTKPGKPAPQEAITQEGKLLESSVQHRGDYYSSLVAVAVLAVLGIMTSLVLLLVLLRRHRAASAPICSPAVGSARSTPALPPYDSPTYKLDLQQETMDL